MFSLIYQQSLIKKKRDPKTNQKKKAIFKFEILGQYIFEVLFIYIVPLDVNSVRWMLIQYVIFFSNLWIKPWTSLTWMRLKRPHFSKFFLCFILPPPGGAFSIRKFPLKGAWIRETERERRQALQIKVCKALNQSQKQGFATPNADMAEQFKFNVIIQIRISIYVRNSLAWFSL